MRLNQHGNTDLDYDRANNLRNYASPFEKKLWVNLREAAKQNGLKFRRQQAIHPYIADFACMETRLIVELDGMSHDTRLAHDQRRDEYLSEKGFTILRFTNNDVAKNVEGVAQTIINHATKLIATGKGSTKRHSPLPNPPHKGEGTMELSA